MRRTLLIMAVLLLLLSSAAIAESETGAVRDAQASIWTSIWDWISSPFRSDENLAGQAPNNPIVPNQNPEACDLRGGFWIPDFERFETGTSARCCGETTDEYMISYLDIGDGWSNVDQQDPTDNACCDDPGDCVSDGDCFSQGINHVTRHDNRQICYDNAFYYCSPTDSCDTMNGYTCVFDAGEWGFTTSVPTTETSCTDGQDNDCDGRTDDADSDCTHAECGGQGEPACAGACDPGLQECSDGNCWNCCSGGDNNEECGTWNDGIACSGNVADSTRYDDDCDPCSCPLGARCADGNCLITEDMLCGGADEQWCSPAQVGQKCLDTVEQCTQIEMCMSPGGCDQLECGDVNEEPCVPLNSGSPFCNIGLKACDNDGNEYNGITYPMYDYCAPTCYACGGQGEPACPVGDQCDAGLQLCGNDTCQSSCCTSDPACAGHEDGHPFCVPAEGDLARYECTLVDGCYTLDPNACNPGEVCQEQATGAICTDAPCEPRCGSRVCGPDPNCGQSCGTCSSGSTCNELGQCVSDCDNTCQSLGYECGTQTVCGTQTNCGSCLQGYACQGGHCVLEGCTDDYLCENQDDGDIVCLTTASDLNVENYVTCVKQFDGCLDAISSSCPEGETCSEGTDGPCVGVGGICGDGVLDPGEECDDGNTVGGDGCSADCTIEQGSGICGDGVLDPGEECDDGADNGVWGSCSLQCVLCYDPEIGPYDITCAPGWHIISGDFDSDSCGDFICAPDAYCGDGTIEPGEQCENMTWGNIQGCSDFDDFTGGDLSCGDDCLFDVSQCTGTSGECGDGVINEGEQCDDGIIDFTITQEEMGIEETIQLTRVQAGIYQGSFTTGGMQGDNEFYANYDVMVNIAEQQPFASISPSDINPLEAHIWLFHDGTAYVGSGQGFDVTFHWPNWPNACADFDDFSGGILACTGTCVFDTSLCLPPVNPVCPLVCDEDGSCEELCQVNPYCTIDPDCTSSECTDTDGGIVYGIQGNVTVCPIGDGPCHIYNDTCTVDGTLKEYYCGEDGFVEFEYIDCEEGCEAGACVGGTGASCTDTDGGIVYGIQGNVTVCPIGDGPCHIYNDTCTVDGTLKEYYCDGLQLGETVQDCDCVQGACLSSGTQCSDAADNDGDGLIDLAEDPGCAAPDDNDESDSSDYDGDTCPDAGDLAPAIPSEDFDTDGVHDDCDNCPYDENPSQADSDGDGIGDACDEPAGWSCGDTDGGIIYDAYGEVTTCPPPYLDLSCHLYTDSCINDTTLLEYYCSGSEAASVTTDCDCVNGTCVNTTAVCGNGIIEPGEECDLGVIPSTFTCEFFGYAGGVVTCSDRCVLDFSGCTDNMTDSCYVFEEDGNHLDIREPLGNVNNYLTGVEIDALDDQIITTTSMTSTVRSMIQVGTGSPIDAIQPIAVNLAEDEQDTLGDFMVVDDSEPFLYFYMTFDPPIDFLGLVNHNLTIAGREYEVIEAYAPPHARLVLSDGHTTMVVADPSPTGSFDGNLTIDGNTIEDATTDFTGNESGGQYLLEAIHWWLRADAAIGSRVYLPPGHGLGEVDYLDEPEGLLGIEYFYERLFDRPTKDLSLVPNAAGDTVVITFNNSVNTTYRFELLSYNGTDLWFGADTGERFFYIEGADENDTVIHLNDRFLIVQNGISRVLELEAIDTSDRIVIFTDLATGESLSASYTAGAGNLYGTHHFTVNETTETIALDLNGDGLINGSQVDIVLGGEKSLKLPDNIRSDGVVPTTPFAIFFRTEAAAFENAITPSVLSIVYDLVNDEIRISDLQYSGPIEDTTNAPWGDFDMINDGDDYSHGLTDYGTMVSLFEPPATPEALTISYPDRQVYVRALACIGQHTKTGCNDGLDNDGDGLVDLEDQDCSSYDDPYEGNDPAVCGNDIREGTEACDGTDFGGRTCQSFSFLAGPLSCNADCTINTDACPRHGGSGGGGGGGYYYSPPDDDVDGGGNSCDQDLDGYYDPQCELSKAADCNDRNPFIHPYAWESCNGKDDDCDGIIDEKCEGDEQQQKTSFDRVKLTYDERWRVNILEIAEYGLTLRNPTDEFMEYEVEMDLPGGWDYDGPRTVSVAPGDSQRITFRLAVPPDERDTQELELIVRSGESVLERATVTARLNMPFFTVAELPSLEGYEPGDEVPVFVVVNNNKNRDMEGLQVETDLNSGSSTLYVELLGTFDVGQDDIFVYEYSYPAKHLLGRNVEIMGELWEKGKLLDTTLDPMG